MAEKNFDNFDAGPVAHRKAALFADHPLSPIALASGERTVTASCIIVMTPTRSSWPATSTWKFAAELLAAEGLSPVLTSTGHAVSSLWMMRYADTSLGPYVEIVLTLAATTSATPPRALSHVADYAALLLDPDVVVFCHRLLLNHSADLAIAYGRDLLHLDKEGVDLVVERTTSTTVQVKHGEAVVLAADVGVTAPLWTQIVSGMMRVLSQVGLSRTLQTLKVSSVTVRAPRRLGGGAVRSLLRGRAVLRPFDPAHDRLTVGPGLALTDDLARLAFAPKLVQRIPHAQFVMYPAT